MDTQKLLKVNSKRLHLQLPEAPLIWTLGLVHILHIMLYGCLWVSAAWGCASLKEETDILRRVAEESQTQLYLPR